MAAKRTFLVLTILLSIFITIVISDDDIPIPGDKGEVEIWFEANVKPFKGRDGLDPALTKAEKNPKLMKVSKDGKGEFKTINEAIDNIPNGNTQRVIISIAPGTYTEKVIIDKDKPFLTLLGSDRDNMPIIVFGDRAAEKGLDCATVIVQSDYFRAVNIVFKNSAPKPDVGVQGQALALRLSGDKAAIYNCKFYGFQDTLFDDEGRHFFKDCYIEGFYDFVYGSGKSIYLNTELHAISNPLVVVTAQARVTDEEDAGFSFVHCRVTGTGTTGYLGRPWKPYAKVSFAYTEISDVIKPEGWYNNRKPETEELVTFGEYKNEGPGANPKGRAKFSKQLSAAEVKPYITLSFIEGSKWLLPVYE